MKDKNVEDALLKDSVDRLWIFCKDMSAKLDGAIFKKDIQPYAKLLFGVVSLILSTIILAVLKLIIK